MDISELDSLMREYYLLGGTELVAKGVLTKFESSIRKANILQSGAVDEVTSIRLNENRYEVEGGWPPHKWRWFEWGTLMPEVKVAMQNNLHSGDRFVDIGAAMGDTVLYADSLGVGKTLAFEPNPGLYEALVTNVDRNSLSGVTTENVAVGPKAGEVAVEEVLGDTFDGYRDQINSETIDVVSLDSHLSDKPDLIKVDVDGAEYGVLKGAQTYLGQVPILLELHHSQLLSNWKDTVELIFKNSNRVLFIGAQGTNTSSHRYGDELTSPSDLPRDQVVNLLIN